jgi:hypothetical protein
VLPWKPLLVKADREDERMFIDVMVRAAAAAGITPEPVPSWPWAERPAVSPRAAADGAAPGTPSV